MNIMFKDRRPNITFILSEYANDLLRYKMYDKLGKLHEEMRGHELDVNSSAIFANDVFGYQLSIFLNGDIENCDIKQIIECITKVVFHKQEVTQDECKLVVYGYGIFKSL